MFMQRQRDQISQTTPQLLRARQMLLGMMQPNNGQVENADQGPAQTGFGASASLPGNGNGSQIDGWRSEDTTPDLSQLAMIGSTGRNHGAIAMAENPMKYGWGPFYDQLQQIQPGQRSSLGR
ncbi:hypothetical protein BMI91_16950 [Thioclava sediminum]|uniref:Uncharacterized protein n=1 Tax=Thioclava sediminum TaxID=1915319 RepID=A0ABX3MUT0_9RHOB|nr:hypothetical protein BMI91_16950 [Thioclava sediminum]